MNQVQLEQAKAQVRAQEAKSRAGWYQLIAAQEQARFQVASLKANIANLNLRRADQTLAEKEYARTSRLVPSGAATQEELEQRQAALDVVRNQVKDAEETVQQTRAGLGLSPDAEHPGQVPKDLDQTYSAVQVALSNAMLSLAQIGVPFKLHGMTPKALYDQLQDMSPGRDINQSLDELVQWSPSTILA